MRATAASACMCWSSAGASRAVLRYSSDLHCAECDLHYQEATQGLFSFNSPIGACDTCRGFGRVIGIDYGLVVPDDGQVARRRRGASLADALLQGVPGRPAALREEARHRDRRALARSAGSATASGSSRAKGPGTRRSGTARAASSTGSRAGLQDAHSRAALEISQLHACAAPARARASSPMRCSGGWDRSCAWSADALAGAAGLAIHAGDAAADRALPRILRAARRCRRRSIRPPTCCSASCARG